MLLSMGISLTLTFFILMVNKIYRCYVLDEQQEMFLRDRRYKIDRHNCFMTLIDRTVRVSTMVDISDHRQLELVQGQFMVSDVELSSLWGVDRKTVSKLMKKMECLGMFTSTKVAEVCVYSMHVLSAWYVDGSLFKNQFYHNPGRPDEKPTWKIPVPNHIFPKSEEQSPIEGSVSADNASSFDGKTPPPDDGEISSSSQAPPIQTSALNGKYGSVSSGSSGIHNGDSRQ